VVNGESDMGDWGVSGVVVWGYGEDWERLCVISRGVALFVTMFWWW
jgi:hypothetical protein